MKRLSFLLVCAVAIFAAACGGYGNGGGVTILPPPPSTTPVKVEPPSFEYIARIGKRWISFAPAITFCGLAGLMAIDVSLCDPHS